MDWRRVAVVACLALGSQACDMVPGTPQYRARQALADYLIDPGSAKITVSSHTPEAVCGTVNAKNRMGGYVGRHLFIVEGKYGSPVVFGEAPSIGDYRTWSSDTQSTYGKDAYNKMEDGCAFPARWEKLCPPGRASDIPIDEPFCSMWTKKDFQALSAAASY